jgi:endonuclease/exonuclease/phosphatase family metal-dependent hydrolase
MRPLERVFVKGRAEVLRCYRGRMQVARQASDHLALTSLLRVG